MEDLLLDLKAALQRDVTKQRTCSVQQQKLFDQARWDLVASITCRLLETGKVASLCINKEP
eukprot:4925440-Prorocentrum_lima.AAC.1